MLAIVKDIVYPQRMKQRREIRKRFWWRYGEVAPALYQTIAPLDRVLVTALTSKYLSFTFVDSDWVYAHACGVIATDKSSIFAVLQSSFHDMWARTHGSTLETRLRYTPADVFETFPLIKSNDDTNMVGQKYYKFRSQLMLDRQEGLTKTYNRFHDPDETAQDIARLRELHVEMDNAVAAAYGWQDLDLGHGFHETAQGIRYTVSEAARRELLTRLLQLNHERYEEEVKLGLHEKKKGSRKGATKGRAKPRRKKKPKKNEGQLPLL